MNPTDLAVYLIQAFLCFALGAAAVEAWWGV